VLSVGRETSEGESFLAAALAKLNEGLTVAVPDVDFDIRRGDVERCGAVVAVGEDLVILRAPRSMPVPELVRDTG